MSISSEKIHEKYSKYVMARLKLEQPAYVECGLLRCLEMSPSKGQAWRLATAGTAEHQPASRSPS